MSTLASGLIKKSTSYQLDPTKITRREGWNTRFDFGEIEALSSSIFAELQRDLSSGGLLNPIRVKRLSDKDPRSALYSFELIDGDRRLQAITLLIAKGVIFPEGIPGVIVDRTQDDLTSTVQMMVANTGKPFLPLEEAAVYKRLRDGGMTIAAICTAVGRTDVHVRETLGLLEASAELQAAVADGKIAGSVGKLIAAVAKGDAVAQADLVADAKAAKGKDDAAKAAKASLAKKINDKRDAKKTAAGKEVKMRALTDAQLSEMGAKLAKHLEVVSKEAGFAEVLKDAVAYRDMISKDEKLAAAFTFGALQALLAAAGQKIDLTI